MVTFFLGTYAGTALGPPAVLDPCEQGRASKPSPLARDIDLCHGRLAQFDQIAMGFMGGPTLS